MPYLLFEHSRIKVPFNREALIGREGLDVVVKTDSGVFRVGKDPTVSRKHTLIYWDITYYITDLGSTNGTYVDGKPIKTERLQFGQLIRVGCETIFRFVDTDEEYFTERTLILTDLRSKDIPNELAYKVPFGDKVIVFIKPATSVANVRIDDEPKRREEINKASVYALLSDLKDAVRNNDVAGMQAVKNVFEDEKISIIIQNSISNYKEICDLLDLILEHPEYLNVKREDLIMAIDVALKELKIKALMRWSS